MLSCHRKLDKLVELLKELQHVAVAVSGGIDSMLLAYIANQVAKIDAEVFHAFSPAVPQESLDRIHQYAEQFQWNLHVVDAEELSDESYTKNPVNRCYYCKSNLYNRIQSLTTKSILSGTNKDDLGDYRPGLIAASETNVLHPYVMCDINKSDIYEMAKHYQLSAIKNLAAQPCLASRVETGIHIDHHVLSFIEEAEKEARFFFKQENTVRCRVTSKGVYLEIDSAISEHSKLRVGAILSDLCEERGMAFRGIRDYKKGSAFVNVGDAASEN